MVTNYKDRVTANPDIMLGKPIIKGTRITIEHILDILADGMSIDEILEAYPNLEREDILSAISYSVDVISREELIDTKNTGR